jgi:branched-subunit amino acid transport protein
LVQNTPAARAFTHAPAVALEAILIPALLAAHLAEELQLTKAPRLHPVALDLRGRLLRHFSRLVVKVL